MAEAHKLCYIVVVDDHTRMGENESSAGPGPSQSLSFRYTYAILQSTLQLMGCKTRLAFKISKKVFEIVKAKALVDPEREVNSLMDAHKLLSNTQEDCIQCFCIGDDQAGKMVETVKASADKDKSLHLHKKRLLAVLRREIFLDIVCDALAQYRYVGPNQRTDLAIACRIRERNESITILLCGASGCGKSTLSSLLASRLAITTVVSTDSIRHMMRGFMNENENPLLWASTYHAGECLDPIAVAEAKAKKKEKKITRLIANGEHSMNNIKGNVDIDIQPANNVTQEVVEAYKTQIYEKNVTDGNKADVGVERVSSKTMAIEGYKAQSEMVIDSLDRLITIWEVRKQSVVIEGVHLSLNFVMGLMRKHPSVIPFMIYIANEEKHLERFAVRAKYMTLDPAKNRYVKYIRNIRTIQEYLCKRAEKHLVPKINNTNVDKSVGSIHATIFSCLRRRYGGEQLYDQATNTVKLVDEEYRNCCAGNSLSSKGMFKLIQRQGSSRQLMALVNTDGSVAKAWPIEVAYKSGKANTSSRSNSNIGSPMYGPLQVGKEEPVNLQFGKFGISSWPDDAVGTSHAHGFDEDEQPNHYSSMSNSPRNSDGPAKEPIGGSPVSVSEEEEDAEVTQLDDEDDLSDSHVRAEDELGGSVDEGSARSDEGSEEVFSYDDEGDDWPEKSEVIDIEGKPTTVNIHRKEIQANTVQNTASLIMKQSFSKHVHEKLPSSTEENRKHLHRHTRRSKSGNIRTHQLRNRTKSLPSFEEHSLSDHADGE